MIRFDNASRDAEKECPCEVGNGVVEHIGCVGDRDTTASGLGEIDVIVANRDARYDFEFWCSRKELGIDSFTARDDDAIAGT